MYFNSSSIPSLYHTVNFPASTFYRPVFYRGGSGYHNPLMDTDIVKTRRERLRALIAKRFGGKQSRMVEDTGINAGELSGLLRTKHFGEKKARALEDQLGLPALWLDGEAKAPTADNAELLGLWEYLLPSQRQDMLEQMRPLAAHNKEVMEQLSPQAVTKRTVSVSDRRMRQNENLPFAERRKKHGQG